MKLSHTIAAFLLLPIGIALPSSCVNVENVAHPANWPQIISIKDFNDIEGVYENNGERTGSDDNDLPMGELWFYFTRKKKQCDRDSIVKIEKAEINSLQITLMDHSGKTIESTILSSTSDFKLVEGYILLPSESGFSGHPLGSGVGTANFILHLAEGGLIGKKSGKAAGLFLHIIPTIGFGSDWYFWKKINNVQHRLAPESLM
ncbi:MAG: hypothetical protein JXB49_08625 [Bacteroidales bacterium]|nr:hypothetical protein [Bacteroidales bacterium]